MIFLRIIFDNYINQKMNPLDIITGVDRIVAFIDIIGI
jgi:hypothetical protein